MLNPCKHWLSASQLVLKIYQVPPYGVFREVLGALTVGPRVSFALEVNDLGEFEEFILARRDVNLADSQRNTLFQETRSHGRLHRRWLLLSHGDERSPACSTLRSLVRCSAPVAQRLNPDGPSDELRAELP